MAGRDGGDKHAGGGLRRRRRWIGVGWVALLAAFLFAGPGGPRPAAVAATSIDDLREKIQQANTSLKDLERQQAEAQRRLKDLQQDEAAILERIRVLEEQIRVTRVRLAELDQQVRDVEQRVEAKQKEIDEATRRLEQREDYVARRIRAIQENGTVGVLEVLLEADSFADFLTRLDLLSRILRHDLDVMAQVKAERERLLVEKRELDQQRQQLVALRQQVDQQRRQLTVTVASHRGELAKLAEQRQAVQRELEILERDSREVESQLRQLNEDLKRRLAELQRSRSRAGGSGSPSGGGRFAWPVPGEYSITSGFGWRRHPITGQRRMHTGVDIDAEGPPHDPQSEWDDVVAADDGIVVVSGFMSGYGNTIVIAHDETISTLYGHLSQRYVGVNEVVRRGQPIGRVGTTGFSTGTHLHFEVRVNGQPVNPMSYLR